MTKDYHKDAISTIVAHDISAVPTQKIESIKAAENAGFPPELLISVAPHDALGIEPGGLGKTPAIPTSEPGYWRPAAKWEHGMLPEVKQRADRERANAGLILCVPVQGMQFAALDFDMLTGETEGDYLTTVACGVRDKAIKALEDHFGHPVWVRQTRPGRAAALVRINPAEFGGRKDVVHLSHKAFDDLGKIELLAKGQQIVIAGIHPVTQAPISWFRTDAPDVHYRVPQLDDGIPVMESRNKLNEALEAVTTRLAQVGVVTRRKKNISDADRGILTPAAHAEEQAPPSADLLITFLGDLPHTAEVGHDSYVAVMHGVVGCMRELGTLGKLTSEQGAAIEKAAVSWASRWVAPPGKVGTTYEAEAAKFKNDWMQRPQIYAGWPTLRNIGTSLGLEDIRQQEAVETFQALEPAPVVSPMHEPVASPVDTRCSDAAVDDDDDDIEPAPTAAEGYLSRDALDDPYRPRPRTSVAIDVPTAEVIVADALVKALRSRAIYQEDTKEWIAWQGKSTAWSSPGGERIVRTWINNGLRNYVARHLPLEKPSVQDKLLSRRAIDAMERLLRDELGRPANTNMNRCTVQTPAGAYDLTTGALMSAKMQKDMVETRCTTVRPKNIPTPEFDKVMSLVCNHDEDVIEWLWSFVGYLMLGHPLGQNLLVIKGPGGNGKGSFCRMIREAMGSYATEAARELVVESGRDQHKTNVYDLKGKRYWFVSEIQPGEKWNEAQIKALTGNDLIYANRMHKDTTRFDAEGTFIIATNNMPRFTQMDEAMRRRFHIIPATAKPLVRDLEIEGRIKATELPGILHKMMRYAQTVFANGFKLPETPAIMRYALQEEQKKNLSVMQEWWLAVLKRGYLGDFGVNGRNPTWQGWVTTDDLHKDYSSFVADRRKGEDPKSKNVLGEFLKTFATKERSSTGARPWGYRFGDLKAARDAFCNALVIEDFEWAEEAEEPGNSNVVTLRPHAAA